MNEITEEVKQELAVKTNDIMTVANGFIIATEVENIKAATVMAGWKQEKKRRIEIFAPSKKATKTAYDEVRKLEAAAVDPIDDAIRIVDIKCGAYVQAENRRRAELQRIEDAKVAELQRKADEKAAEAQRKADEAYRLKCAKAAEANKPPPVAPVVVAAAVVIPQRVIASVSAPAGTSYIARFSAKVVNIKELCAGVAAGTVDPSFVEGVGPALNAWAKLKKIEGPILPGVIGVKTTGTSQRG